MDYAVMDLSAIAHECAPYVAMQTVRAVVKVESGFDPLAIHVNGGRLERQPQTLEEAIVTARALRASGWDFDMGLAQISVRNADRLAVPIERVFDPCTNLRLMQRILQECFLEASRGGHGPRGDLAGALSCYNTGDLRSGFTNGYVGRVVAAAKRTEAEPQRAAGLQRAASTSLERDDRHILEETSR